MQTILRTLILNAAPMLAGGVSWITRPGGFPAATLQTIGEAEGRTYEGRTDLENENVQIDIWALSYAVSTAAARAILSELDGAGAAPIEKIFVTKGRETAEDLEGLGKVFRVTLTAAVWWRSE